MAVTITWNDGVNPAEVFAVSEAAVAAVEAYRATQRSIDPQSGLLVTTYPDLKTFVVAMLVQKVLVPSMDAFPPAAVATAKGEVDTATATLAAAKALAIASSLTVSEA